MLSNTAYADTELEPEKLISLSLAELSNIEVTSVSKKAEKENDAAAAIYVITQDDIKHSGATTIPDLLRAVPGLTVTQVGAHDWTVTSRGFSRQFANKLLVLMDGRTIYSPLFGGVVWDVQDTMLEDIDRIEVIRGPGATLWGANAVNGVINIITKNAQDTQGGLAVASAGNEIKGIGSVREGVKIADNSYVRTYAKFTDYNSEPNKTGGSAGDSWHRSQAGFRSDSKISESDKLTVQGDIYENDENSPYIYPDINSLSYTNSGNGVKASGGNVLARWESKNSKDSQTSLQMYVDNTYYKESYFNDNTTTADLDFQHVWTGWDRQEIVWGTGYRLVDSKNDPATQQYALTPPTRKDNLFNAFLQDKFTLIPSSVFLTLGSKIEHNAYTGIEVQPSARLSWLPTDNQTVWAAVSRAVHTPNRFNADGRLALDIIPPGGVPALVQSTPNTNLDSEELIAYELGYRIQPTKSSSLDIATFYNDYSKLFFDTLGTPVFPVFPGPYAIQPVVTVNSNAAYSTGIEISGKLNVYDNWQLAASYSYIDLVFDNKSSPTYIDAAVQPKNQFNVRSNYKFSNGVEMTNALYYVDQMSGISIPSYYRFDSKLSYQFTKNIELDLVGQNLFDHSHQEFNPFLFRNAADIGRSIYGSVAVKF